MDEEMDDSCDETPPLATATASGPLARRLRSKRYVETPPVGAAGSARVQWADETPVPQMAALADARAAR
eukprot:6757195-Lingulodinium_polyedra.AAC.1